MSQEALESIEKLIEASVETFITVNRHGQVITWSKGAEKTFGYSADAVQGEDILAKIFDPEPEAILKKVMFDFLGSEEQAVGQKLMVTAHDALGKSFPVEITINPSPVEEDEDDFLFHLFIIDKSAEQEAESKALNLEAVVEGNPEATIITSQDGIIVSWNKAAEDLYQYSENEQLGQSIQDLTPNQQEGVIDKIIEQINSQESLNQQHIFEAPQKTSQGTFQAHIIVNPLSNHDLIWSIHDITEHKETQQQLDYLQEHHQLTHLPNRQSFINHLNKLLAGKHQGGAIIVIDIDNFRVINDSFGHDVGDKVLQLVAKLLKKEASDHYLAHLGVDEFAILTDSKNPVALGQHLLNKINEIDKRQIGSELTASAGIILFTEQTTRDADEMLSATDAALFDAKELNGNQVSVFAQDKLTQLDLAKRIRTALEKDYLTLYSQPIVDLNTGETVQRELLLRLNDPELGVLEPQAFLAAASKLGLMGEIDRWVACRGIEEAARNGAVEINLSGAAMTDNETLRVIQEKLTNTDVDPNKVIFEITETIAISNLDDAANFANALKDLGARFALDDFGTGFGSFTYLKHLPVAVLKIDGEFIRNMLNSEVDQRIVQAIVFIAEGMGLSTVAEWVDNEEVRDKLKSWGVDYAQGFLIGKPTPLRP